MKKIIISLLTIYILISLCSCKIKDSVNNLDSSSSSSDIKETIEALDYSNDDNWVSIQKDGTKEVDVFYIYPTVAMETENEDGFASISEMENMAHVIRLAQASAYEESCNVYMPFYRQIAMSVIDNCNKDNATFLSLLDNSKAYFDIVAALDYYFENYNNGKPFVLAGHSQGSAMLITVLTHYMQEHKDYLSRMVAAYCIGLAPSEDIFNETTGLKFATKEDDINVVISFTTEGPTAAGKSILLPENPMVINPLNWKIDDTYASKDLNKGMIKIAPTYDSITIVEGKDDAQINLDRKTIICTTRSSDEYTINEASFATESFHEKEYSMYYGNLRENVQTRIDAYFAEK